MVEIVVDMAEPSDELDEKDPLGELNDEVGAFFCLFLSLLFIYYL